MEFYSNTRKPARKQESFTNRFQAVYRKEINKKTGKKQLVKDKDVDIYAQIQEYAEESKLSNILQRYNINMLSKLKEGETQLVDLTNLPENLMETMTVIDNARYLWERQSKDLKAQFNNNFNEFIAGSENGKIMEVLQKNLSTSQDKFISGAQANYFAPVTPAVQPTQPAQTTTEQGGIVTNV